MENLAGEEGVENFVEGPTEGVLIPLDSEGGKGRYIEGEKNLNSFERFKISLCNCNFFRGTYLLYHIHICLIYLTLKAINY